MKTLKLLGLAVFMLSTVVEPVLAEVNDAGTSSMAIESEREMRLSDLGMKLNPQLGVSSFEYSGKTTAGEAKQKLSGGLTVEFGGAIRKMETGLLVVQTGASSYLTIPMMAKLRVISMRAQSWYGKFGFMPAFEIGSSNRNTTNIDVIGALGAGGRLTMTKKSDFIIEATYNRGLIDAVRSNSEQNYNQGILVMAGVSISI